MHFSVAALLAVIGTVVQASPAASPIPASPLEVRATNDCGDSSFINRSSGGSPKADDCQKMADTIKSEGNYVVQCGNVHQLTGSGTCCINVQSNNCALDLYQVGGQDLIDVTTDSLRMFTTTDGLMGAEGTMDCQHVGAGATVPVTWGIYRC